MDVQGVTLYDRLGLIQLLLPESIQVAAAQTRNCSDYSLRLTEKSHHLGDGRLIPILFGCSHVIPKGRGTTLPRCQEEIALQTMLLGVQLEVTSAQCIEFFVSAAFDNLSLLDPQNLIGAPNGRQAV